MAQPVFVCLNRTGETLARRLAPGLGAAIHGRAGRTGAAVLFEETTAHVRDLFAAGHPVIGICAAGILIRSVAAFLADKTTEPPVLALAEDGSAIVPLLGGHRGANDLARSLARELGIAPALTTAGDVSHGLALDAPAAGWRLANPQDATAAMAAITNGALVITEGEMPWASMPFAPEMSLDGSTIRLTGTTAPTQTGPDHLVYHPASITLGVGCSRNCPPQEMSDLVHAALEDAGVAPLALAGVFSLDLKADEAAILDLATELRLPFRNFDASTLEAQTPRLANPSDVVFQEVGCHGVAEAAALAAAGSEGVLILGKRKSANATVALARAPAPITQTPGNRRGRVALIGIGPGQSAWRTPEASQLIAAADELVGYGLYIDLLGPLAIGKPRADFPLGGEEDRCRYALEEAAKGRSIAVICSGDAGIYAMGALVYELMARTDHGVSDAARRVDVITAPGISALQAAAARAGAPLGHDFCAISLSDLLTPRAAIERRIKAAAEGDFVIAFYNPVSKRRRTLFGEAIETLLSHRPDDTPVVLASSLGRPEEEIRLRTLASVTTDEVDMLTTVIVGASQSRTVRVGGRDRVFTPRGYAKKHEDNP